MDGFREGRAGTLAGRVHLTTAEPSQLTTDDRRPLEAARRLEPDAIVGQPSLVVRVTRGRALLAADTRVSIGSLRAASTSVPGFVRGVDADVAVVSVGPTDYGHRVPVILESKRSAKPPAGDRPEVSSKRG